MAAFLDGCRFVAVSTGTGDFVVSAAVAGCMTPAVANAVNATKYKYHAESFDRSQWEDGEGAYTVGSVTLARTTVLYNSAGTGTLQSGAGSKISFTAAPQVAIVALKEDLISVEEANTFSATQRAQARNNIAALLRGSKPYGLTLSTAGNSGTFSIAAGEAADSTGVDLMTLAAGINKTNGNWTVGSGGGGQDTTAAFVTNQWEHVYLIKRPDTGVVDICYSASATAPTFGTNIPAAYTLYRRIGSILTAPSGISWVKFFQRGSIFLWDVSVQNVNAGTLVSASGTSVPLTTPLGVRTEANIHVAFTVAATGVGILVSSLDISDQVAGAGLPNVGFTQVSGGVCLTGLWEYTDLSSSVRMRCGGATSCTHYVWTVGWDDIALEQGI